MAVNIHKNYPIGCLEASYPAVAGQAIEAGMLVKINATGSLVKADNTSGENAWLAMSSQPLNWMDQGGKIQVVKGNGSFWTSMFSTGGSNDYTDNVNAPLYVDPGAAGYFTTVNTGGTSTSVGRLLSAAPETINNVSMICFDLTRS